MKRVTITLLLLALAASACTGTSEEASSTSTSEVEGTDVPIDAVSLEEVVVRLGGDWNTIDPPMVTQSYDYQMVMSLYDRLVALDETGEVVPALAESWEATEGGGLRFTINEEATCADGTPLTPEAVAASLERTGDPETATPFLGRSAGSGYSVEADNEQGTVTVNPDSPFSDLLTGMAMPWMSIVCPAGLEDAEVLETVPYGSGPYTLAESSRGDSYVLESRDDYTWGPEVEGAGAELPDRVVYRVIESDTTAANLLLNGEIDIAPIGGPDLNRVLESEDLIQKSALAFVPSFLLFNETEGYVTEDEEVRRALAMAVDRSSYNQAATLGFGEVADSLIASNVACYESLEESIPAYDPEGAVELLAEAGWVPNDDGQLARDGETLVVRIAGWDQQNAGPEYVLEALEEIGVQAELTVLELGALLDLYGAGDWEVTPYPSGPPMPSANMISAQFSGPPPPDGINWGLTDNTEYEALVEDALAVPPGDEAQACELWNEALRSLITNVDASPLATNATYWFGNGVDFTLPSAFVVEPTAFRTAG